MGGACGEGAPGGCAAPAGSTESGVRTRLVATRHLGLKLAFPRLRSVVAAPKPLAAIGPGGERGVEVNGGKSGVLGARPPAAEEPRVGWRGSSFGCVVLGSVGRKRREERRKTNTT